MSDIYIGDNIMCVKESWRQVGHVHGYIDVGDGCWRRNVLVTGFGFGHLI